MKTICVNRINLKSGGFSVIAYILGTFMVLLSVFFIIIGEYLGLFIPFAFLGFGYLFVFLSNAEKIIFLEDEIQEKHFGKLKKTIRYSEICSINGVETGSALVKALSSETIDNSTKSIGRGTYLQKIDSKNISKKEVKGGFKFIVISKVYVDDSINPISLTRDKDHIVMHYYSEVSDFLKSKISFQ